MASVQRPSDAVAPSGYARGEPDDVVPVEVEQLGDDARLADARLAEHQDGPALAGPHRASSATSSRTSVARPTIGTARGSTDSARSRSLESGAQTTSTVASGGSPLSSSSPTGTNVWTPREPARIRTTSAARI